jgi:hypothetical protein
MKPNHTGWFARFVSEHLLWDFLVSVFVNYYVAGIAVVAGLLVARSAWLRKQPSYLTNGGVALLYFLVAFLVVALTRSFKKKAIAEIRFDYLPELPPEKQGWGLLMDQGNMQPTFGLARNTPTYERCLHITGGGYRLDYTLQLHDSFCKSIEYDAKVHDINKSVVYAQVQMLSKDGAVRDGWLARKFDTEAGVSQLDEHEWTLTDPGKPIADFQGWKHFKWSLAKEVKRTFGTASEKWRYKRTIRIRLRGTIEISPIQLIS